MISIQRKKKSDFLKWFKKRKLMGPKINDVYGNLKNLILSKIDFFQFIAMDVQKINSKKILNFLYYTFVSLIDFALFLTFPL